MSRVQTSPPLDELLLCQHFAKNLTRRACLRRQLERQESRASGEGPPVRAYCASGKCELGNRVRQEHDGLHLGTCRKCGTALVGVTACPTCTARAAEKAGTPPRVLPVKPEVSTRIWDPRHTEPAFVPPRSSTPASVPSLRLPSPTVARLVPASLETPEERLAAADAARMRELDQALALERCRHCGTKLYDNSLERHPGSAGSPSACGRR